jgi:serine phosphatase RsbU (regulator of sigma subunit)
MRNSGNEVPGYYNVEFDELPPDLKYSNIDNAYHIPTKLLAIGYRIRPAGKGYKPIALHLRESDVETMARVEHLRWSWDKRLNGWRYGNVKDSSAMTHPDIKPYNKLGRAEKEKDRELVRMIPAILKDIGYEACPVNPYSIRKLSYAAKPHSSIRRILDETRNLNEQIRNLVMLTPEVEVMAGERNRKIEEAINEIEGSYNYAKHIQEAFLPDDLYIRECFPESFVLFKPRDIVSGDFYFFSRNNDNLIFAAADCTGHGIPGALLSTIGYGTLDQAVNEFKLTNPVDILTHLYSKIHRFLRFGQSISGMSDDMDIALCSYNMNTARLTYSGVANPLYIISEDMLTEYKAGGIPKDDISVDDSPFQSEEIQLKAGDSVYLFSDGYTDQLGGKNHKRYQSARFKNFLISIFGKPMAEQSDLLYEEFERWRGEKNEDQTDDILVIGIRI